MKTEKAGRIVLAVLVVLGLCASTWAGSHLQFDGGDGGICDTGFTHVLPGTDDSNCSLLSLTGGELIATTANGEPIGGGTAEEYNYLVVPFDLSSSFIAHCKINNPQVIDNFDQGGIFVGTNADNWVKTTAVSVNGTDQISSIYEVSGSPAHGEEQFVAQGQINTAQTVDLWLEGDGQGNVAAYYSIDGGPRNLTAEFYIPTVLGSYGFAGLWTTNAGLTGSGVYGTTVDIHYDHFSITTRIFHVDGATGDNSNDGFTRGTAFETIQHGIDTAYDGDTVLVWPGVYNEAAPIPGINFGSKAITVKSAADAAVLEMPGLTAITFNGADANSVFSNFVIRGCNTGIFVYHADPTIEHITIVGNNNGLMADTADPNITNCIFWNNTNGDLYGNPEPITTKHSLVQDDIEPISYWKLDGDATDSAGSNDGTIYGATPTTGQINDALDFNGVDDYVDCGNDNSLKPPLPVTISAWIKLNSTGINQFVVGLDKRVNYYYGIWFYVSSDNTLRVGYGDGGPADMGHRRSKAGTTELTPDIWYHVTAIINGPTDMTFYVNGIDDGGIYGGSGGSLTYSTGKFSIGSENLSRFFFSGTIDNVRIYDKALSAEEIEQMYEVGLAGHEFSPLFADADANDYHLLSERGRYVSAYGLWDFDDVTSPCVDGGDPYINPSNERMPNGGRINMGAYGNTATASMSEWSMPGDINRDGLVDMIDYAMVAQDWLKKEEWKN